MKLNVANMSSLILEGKSDSEIVLFFKGLGYNVGATTQLIARCKIKLKLKGPANERSMPGSLCPEKQNRSQNAGRTTGRNPSSRPSAW